MRILPVFIPHAGCQFDCIYCNQKRTSQRSGIPSAETVLAAVDSALADGPLDEVAYYGGSFTALPIAEQKDYLELLKPFLGTGQVGGIRVSTRPDALDVEIVDLLGNAGVTTVELGCQTFSDKVLKTVGRGHLAADACASVSLLRSGSFNLGIQLMPGLPGADTVEAISSLETALSLQPDFLRIYPAVVIKETGLAEMWLRGDYIPLTLEQAVDICADMDLVCQAHSVPVVRYGLQANTELDSGAVLDGPYHPAFGQMVRSRVWRRAISRLRKDEIDVIDVHPSDLSDAIGHGRSNVSYVRDIFGAITVRQDGGIARSCIGVRGEQRNVYTLAGSQQAGCNE